MKLVSHHCAPEELRCLEGNTLFIADRVNNEDFDRYTKYSTSKYVISDAWTIRELYKYFPKIKHLF